MRLGEYDIRSTPPPGGVEPTMGHRSPHKELINSKPDDARTIFMNTLPPNIHESPRDIAPRSPFWQRMSQDYMTAPRSL